MNCPYCGGDLGPGATRCAACDVAVVPRVEGALAADPRLLTPPARGRQRGDGAGAPREPGSRRHETPEERSWREEVQRRIRSRRQKRADAGLPLFEQPDVAALAANRAGAAAPSARGERPAPPLPSPVAAPDVAEIELQRSLPVPGEPELRRAAIAEPVPEPELRRAEAAPSMSESEIVTDDRPTPASDGRELLSVALSDAELADLPLRPSSQTQAGSPVDLAGSESFEAVPRRRTSGRVLASPLDPDVLVADGDVDESLELTPPRGEPLPVERPARGLERTQAAAFDLALFTVLGAVAVYFAGRAARVELSVLVHGWPWLGSFLAVLAAFYACYFTGTTGQTPGKLLLGLRVVDRTGRPPGYARATARALVGLLGTCLAGAGLVQMAFDPAGRALHDRLFRTRVIRR